MTTQKKKVKVVRVLDREEGVILDPDADLVHEPEDRDLKREDVDRALIRLTRDVPEIKGRGLMNEGDRDHGLEIEDIADAAEAEIEKKDALEEEVEVRKEINHQRGDLHVQEVDLKEEKIRLKI